MTDEQAEILIKALEFYADPKRYYGRHMLDVRQDGGDMAREALKIFTAESEKSNTAILELFVKTAIDAKRYRLLRSKVEHHMTVAKPTRKMYGCRVDSPIGNPPFRSIGVALGMAVCYRETALRANPTYRLRD